MSWLDFMKGGDGVAGVFTVVGCTFLLCFTCLALQWSDNSTTIEIECIKASGVMEFGVCNAKRKTPESGANKRTVSTKESQAGAPAR